VIHGDIRAANLPCSLTSSHLGWQGVDGEDGFLWGRTLIGPDGEDADTVQFRAASTGDDQLADGYHSAGSFDAWRDGIKSIGSHPYALAIFYAAFAAVLLWILHAPSFVLDICRKTTVGKTTLLRIAASVWGVPDESQRDAAIHTWDATQVWAERAIAVISNLPMILDDTKRAAGKPQIIEDVIYMVVSGQARARGSVDGMARTQTWSTVLLSSGEAPATSYSQAGGTRTRCLELRGYPLGDQSETAGALARNLNSAVCANYGHAGPMFVRYLLKNRQSWQNWREHYQEEIDRCRKLAPGCPEADRVAQAFAAMAITARHVHAALDLPWAYEDGIQALNRIWLDVVAEARDAAGPERALRDVMSWAHSNESKFFGRFTMVMGVPSGWLGRWDSEPEWEFIAFLPTQLRTVLSDLKYEPEAILYEWKSKGWLDTRSDREGGYTKQVPTRDGEKPHMVKILRKAVEEVENSS
jgi:putative DNA primase/helicase